MQPQTESVATERRRTSSSATSKKSRTAPPPSSEQREARKFWNDFTQHLSDQTWLPTTEDELAQTNWSDNTWFTATWKSVHETMKNPQQAPRKKQTHQQQRRRRRRRKNKKKRRGKRKRPKGDNDEQKGEKDDIPDDTSPNEFKVRKIKLRLGLGQRTILNRWFGTFRWTYNRILRAVKQGDVPLHKGKIRAKFINNHNFEADDNLAWVVQTPYEVRDAALTELLAAYKSNFAKRKQNPYHTFDIKFKSKKARSNSFVLHHKHYHPWLNGAKVFERFWRCGTEDNQPGISPCLRGFERLPRTLSHAARLQRTRNGDFYLCIVSPIEVAPASESSDRIIALDPGVRSFMTGFSPAKEGVMECGAGDRTRLFRLCCAYDSLQSRWSKEKHRRRYRMQRAGRRIQERIRNLVNEVHCKLVKWLVTNFDVVLLPKFETQRMCQKTQLAQVAADGTRHKTRKINGKVARAMYTWSHYRFQQRLLHKIREYPQCRVVICDEDFTSKTCGRCGFVHEKLGGNKTFKCPSCHVSLDRDVNGARNIFLRYMTLSHAQ